MKRLLGTADVISNPENAKRNMDWCKRTKRNEEGRKRNEEGRKRNEEGRKRHDEGTKGKNNNNSPVQRG